MESDMVAAVRHRAVPGDLTRSSTCNKRMPRGHSSIRFVPIALSLSLSMCRGRAEFAGIHRDRREEEEPVEFFARYLPPSMGNRATGRGRRVLEASCSTEHTRDSPHK